MRKIRKIVIHCSDSPHAHHDDISVIRSWHVNERKWSDVGYHFFIQANGNIQEGRKLYRVGAHALNHNADSIGICLHGRDKFTQAQFTSLRSLVRDMIQRFNLTPADVYGHYDFSSKTCPNFDVQSVVFGRPMNLDPKEEKRV